MTLFKRVKIHLFYYLVAFIVIITGHFWEFLILSSLIIVHECGHVLMAQYYRWNIEKILLLPFGGLIIFKEKINKPLKEELMILLAGPCSQIIFYKCLNPFFTSPTLTSYHYLLLLFNFLPIIPLDGSKLFNIICNKLFPFKTSHLLTIYLSFIFFLVLFFLDFNLITFLIFGFLIIKVIKEYKDHQFIFNKFLVERTIYNFSFSNIKIIKGLNLSKMFRDYFHLFKVESKVYNETEILKEKFDNLSKL